MTATITKLRPVAQVSKPKSKAVAKRINRQRMASYWIGMVGLTLTVLSLSHLAAGVELLTASSTWHSWAMAVGIDLGFVGLELGQLCITTESLRRMVRAYAKPLVVGTLVASAMMNAYAFAMHATGWQMVAACMLGIAIPGMIYGLTRVSAAMWLDSQK